ncbi:Ribosomal RNA small subunit methyltransferase B [Glycine soja]|uniref:Ribosomal RNA small subunit methyltransferase B n=1 Tax=Glycine soja TaxID=3848 RepID=A0A0B2QUW3_GLYSO|nr:Ribosomal RNA small subunit methyltransferase B [Glycine soja]
MVRRWTKYLGQEEAIKLMIWNNSEPSLVVSVVDPQPGETIIDCCAAPGGKTLYMASHLSGQVVENSYKETAKLHQVDGIIIAIHADLRTLPDSGQLKSNKVLLDAPCSGLGVLSKVIVVDLRWNRNLEDMEQLKEFQDELLDAASKLVKPGGVLVYSSCSIDPEENDDRVFLVTHPDFHIDPVDRYVPPDFVTSSGFFFSNPVKHSVDGSFAAHLVRDLLNEFPGSNSLWLYPQLRDIQIQ